MKNTGIVKRAGICSVLAMLILLLVTDSCKKKACSVPKPPLAVGDRHAGGAVAYIFIAGDPGYVEGEVHGLIAAPYDQDTAVEWGCYSTLLNGANSSEIGTGNANTKVIMDSCQTIKTAARICGNLVLGGYSDWYLPSIKELYAMYLRKEAIGGFVYDAHYWSSSQFDANMAMKMRFNSTLMYEFGKAYPSHVRAVRTF